MSTLTIRLPEDKHARLRELAKLRDMSVNKFIGELATISLAEFDAEKSLPHDGRAPIQAALAIRRTGD